MKILIFIVMFFFIGSLLIIENNTLKMSNPENLNIFCGKFVVWLDRVYSNMQTITGEVVKMDWFSK